MKNLSLTVKIWLSISVVSLLLYILVFLLMPTLLRDFFTNTLMEPPGLPSSKKIVWEPMPSFLNLKDFKIRNSILLRNFMLLDDGTTLPADAREHFPEPLLKEIYNNATLQQSPINLYVGTNKQVPIRYVIRKNMAYGHPLYQVSFIRGAEEDQLVKTFLFSVMPYAAIALLISWFASLLLARYLTRPLIKIQQHVRRIASRNWHEPLTVTQGDEIGQLAGSVETMRQQLVQQDEAQQSMLQNVSHELKTPVMVIRSYAQAMKDGVYPKGDLAGSIQVIEEEGERLEKLVKQLLYLTRLDYLSTRNPVYQKITLNELIEDITHRLTPQRPKINWRLELQPVTLDGDADTLRVMIENLLDNHLRYALSTVEVGLTLDTENKITLSVWNDGSKIEPHVLEQIYQPFQKGHKGKFGLGLAIVQRILKMYHGQITLNNERNGVSSVVQMPAK